MIVKRSKGAFQKHLPNCFIFGLLMLIIPNLALAYDFSVVRDHLILSESEIEKRPLFSKFRRPPPEPEPEPVIIEEPVIEVVVPPEPVFVPPTFRWELIGILRSGEEGMVVVGEGQGNETFNFSLGDRREGWELIEVDPRRALFRNGEIEKELFFRSDIEENN